MCEPIQINQEPIIRKYCNTPRGANRIQNKLYSSISESRMLAIVDLKTNKKNEKENDPECQLFEKHINSNQENDENDELVSDSIMVNINNIDTEQHQPEVFGTLKTIRSIQKIKKEN